MFMYVWEKERDIYIFNENINNSRKIDRGIHRENIHTIILYKRMK